MKKILLGILFSVISITLFSQPWKTYNPKTFLNNEVYSSIRTKINDNFTALVTVFDALDDTLDKRDVTISVLEDSVDTHRSRLNALELYQITQSGSEKAEGLTFWDSFTTYGGTLRCDTSITIENGTMRISPTATDDAAINFGEPYSTLYQPRIYRMTGSNSLRFIDSSSYAKGYYWGYSLDSLFSSGTGSVGISGSNPIGTIPYFITASNLAKTNMVYNGNAFSITVPVASSIGLGIINTGTGDGLYVDNYSTAQYGIDVVNLNGAGAAKLISGSGVGLTIDNSGSGTGLSLVHSGTGSYGMYLENSTINPGFYLYNHGSGYGTHIYNIGASSASYGLAVSNSPSSQADGVYVSNGSTIGGTYGLRISANGVGSGGAIISSTAVGGTPLYIYNAGTYNSLEITNTSTANAINVSTNGSTTFRISRDTILTYKPISIHDDLIVLDSIYIKGLNCPTTYAWLYLDSAMHSVKVDSAVISSRVLLIDLPKFKAWFNNRDSRGELQWYNTTSGQWEYGTIDNDGKENSPKVQVSKAYGGLEMLARYLDNTRKVINVLVGAVILLFIGFVYLFIRISKIKNTCNVC